jgi:hypothetical protein
MDRMIMALVSEERVSKKTLKDAKIAKDFLIKYKIIHNKSEARLKKQKPHLINGFKPIGWSDPFPDDDKHVRGSIDDDRYVVAQQPHDWVYPEYKYKSG